MRARRRCSGVAYSGKDAGAPPGSPPAWPKLPVSQSYYLIAPCRNSQAPGAQPAEATTPSSSSLRRIISRISSAVMSPRNKSAFGSATASFMALIRDGGMTLFRELSAPLSRSPCPQSGNRRTGQAIPRSWPCGRNAAWPPQEPASDQASRPCRDRTAPAAPAGPPPAAVPPFSQILPRPDGDFSLNGCRGS